MDIVFQSLVLYKITYAVQSYSGYFLEQQIDKTPKLRNVVSFQSYTISAKFWKIKITGFSTK